LQGIYFTKNITGEFVNKFDFKGVFNKADYLYFYRSSISLENTTNQIKILLRELDLKPNTSILDAACGHGRHANILAGMGFKVTGVDIMNEFITIAKKDAKKQGLSVEYVKKDLRKINYRNKFDRAIMLFTSFGYFSEEENLLILRNICRTLKKGGLFFLDIINRDAFLCRLKGLSVTEITQDMMIDRVSFDSRTGCSINRRTYLRGGKRHDTEFHVRLYNYNELEKVLEQAGFEIKSSLGDWNGTPFTSNSSRLMVIAKKK